MTGNPLSDDERRKLRRSHGLIYVFPMLAGLVTISLAVLGEMANHPMMGPLVVSMAFGVNAFLAGVASAVVVANQHPHERGKWWRAGTSFLFAFPMTLASVILFGVFAGCSGLIR
jgi:hypothetical protein